MYSVAILKRAVFAYYLLIRLKGLLFLQSARCLVGCEKVCISSHGSTSESSRQYSMQMQIQNGLSGMVLPHIVSGYSNCSKLAMVHCLL